MKERITTAQEDAFEVCLQALQTGAPLEACLQLYPHWKDEFRPALEAAQALMSIVPRQPSATVLQRSRTVLLRQAGVLRKQQTHKGWYGRLPQLAFALALAMALVFGGSSLIATSAQAIPGDQMYPLKRAVEQVRLNIAPSLEQKTAIERAYQQRRVAEILQLFHLQRVVQVSFEGVVQEQQGDYWHIGGVLVALTELTQQIGEIKPGMVVEVEGSTHPGGWVTAHEVHLKARELIGVVQQIQQNFWVVADTRLAITPLTQLDPRVQVGDLVLVMLQAEHDGSLAARAILRYPQPIVVTATPVPTSTPGVAIPTPMPTPALVPQSTPTRVIVEFEGQVMAVAGNLWTIGTQQVVVSTETDWQGAPQIGDWVSVEAWFAPNGMLFAREIEVHLRDRGEQDDFEDDASDEEQEQLQAPDESHEEQREDSEDESEHEAQEDLEIEDSPSDD